MDETDPLAKQTETREDGLDNDLAAHINSKMADLALSSVEKQVKTRVGCSDLFFSNSRSLYQVVLALFFTPRLFTCYFQSFASTDILQRFIPDMLQEKFKQLYTRLLQVRLCCQL